MPPVRGISVANNTLTLSDFRGVVKTFARTDLPNGGAGLTLAQAEDFLNTTWIPANITGYQMQIHITNINPFQFLVLTADIGAPIPANWWLPRS